MESPESSSRRRRDVTVSRTLSYPLSSSQERHIPNALDDSPLSPASAPIDKRPEFQGSHSATHSDQAEKKDPEAGPDGTGQFLTSHRGHELIKRTPIYKTPLPAGNAKWHLDENLSIDWGALFYDLVLVAALSAFTSSHRISEPSAIPSFAAYYVLLYYIWVSQVFYDIRYEAEDSIHRVFKFLQICVIIYIGSASGNWAPENLRSEADQRVRDYESAVTRDAEESFTVIVSAFMASRIILALQYLICGLVGKRLKRSTRPFWVSIASLTSSVIILIIVLAIPSTSKSSAIARLTLLYLTIVLELAILTLQVYRQNHVPADTRKVGERYSAVVLIVLGEGLISLTGAFNDGLSGLSDTDFGTYGQAILAVAIAYLLYCFLFGRFRKEKGTGRKRAIAFELIHFPLTFGLLLLFGAMVNVIIVTSHGRGTASVLESLTLASTDAANNLPLTDDLRERLGRYLYKLPLIPQFDVYLDQLRALHNSSEPTDDPVIVALQYSGQLLSVSFSLYDIEVTDNTAYAFADLINVDSTWTGNDTLRRERVEQATDLLYQVNSDPFVSAMSGTLWLFPAAGIVLILCSLRSLTWSPTGTPLANLVLSSFHITGGLVLALMGLTGVGDKGFDVARYAAGDLEVLPMYNLVLHLIPLIVVCVVYGATYLSPAVVLEVIDRWKEPVFTEQKVGWKRRLGYMVMGI